MTAEETRLLTGVSLVEGLESGIAAVSGLLGTLLAGSFFIICVRSIGTKPHVLNPDTGVRFVHTFGSRFAISFLSNTGNWSLGSDARLVPHDFFHDVKMFLQASFIG